MRSVVVRSVLWIVFVPMTAFVLMRYVGQEEADIIVNGAEAIPNVETGDIEEGLAVHIEVGNLAPGEERSLLIGGELSDPIKDVETPTVRDDYEVVEVPTSEGHWYWYVENSNVVGFGIVNVHQSLDSEELEVFDWDYETLTTRHTWMSLTEWIKQRANNGGNSGHMRFVRVEQNPLKAEWERRREAEWRKQEAKEIEEMADDLNLEAVPEELPTPKNELPDDWVSRLPESELLGLVITAVSRHPDMAKEVEQAIERNSLAAELDSIDTTISDEPGLFD